MKVYVRPRQGGKTHELIKLAAEERLVIVCANLDMVRIIEERARDMNLDIPQPVSWRQITNGSARGRRIKGFVIDDAETCLRMVCGPVPIAAISVTGEVVPPAAHTDEAGHHRRLALETLEP